MGKIARAIFQITVGAEFYEDSWRVPRSGYHCGIWAFHAAPSGECSLTHVPTGLRLFTDLLLDRKDAERAVLALYDAVPLFAGGHLPMPPDWRFLLESVIAAAIHGDYVFGRRSR